MHLIRNLISVVMPVYDVNPDHLKKSIVSILNQTYENLELIVVLDKIGTTKDYEAIEVLNEFESDHRLRTVVHNERTGFVASLNEGILISKGEYLARADSDDINVEHRFDTQLDYLKRNKKDLVGSWACVMDNSGKVVGKLTLPVTTESIRRSIMLHNVILHSSVLMKKEILEKAGLYYPEFFGSEDYELWLRLLSKGYSLANYPEYLLFLRENPDSITRGRAWFKTRISYIRSKEYACSMYGYTSLIDISAFLASFFLLLAHPSVSISLKRILGIYSGNRLSSTSDN